MKILCAALLGLSASVSAVSATANAPSPVSATTNATAPLALACKVTNVTKGVFQISSTGTDNIGAQRQCSFTFNENVTSVKQISINHCKACTAAGGDSVNCQCDCKSISCNFVSTAEVLAPTATNAVCSCSHGN